MKYNNIVKLVISIIICEFAGVIGSVFTVSEINTWYSLLKKPWFNPPNWIFGPVWTTLYILMGISLYLVWSKNWEPQNKINIKNAKIWNAWSEKLANGSWQKINIILIFITQLILNIFWSILFFKGHNLGLAFFELIMLWVAIIFMMINFYRVSKTASLLLWPYILWVSFAGILNFSLWMLN